MTATLLEPFGYSYMTTAIWVSALVGGVCAVLSCYLVLKGWALMGDALSHSVVPGVALAHVIGLPYAIGAFTTALLAALGILAVRRIARLREDAVIGVVFTAFFAAGLLMVSMFPTPVKVQTIILGNILAIGPDEVRQILIISGVCMAVLAALWKDMMVAFFDESHARSVGIDPTRLRVLFFVLLSASTVAALQTVGAVLVIAMVVTPGATAYLLTDRFSHMLPLAAAFGAGTSAVGAYVSFFVDGATGGLIVVLQTLLFLVAYVFAPKHGQLAAWRAARASRAVEEVS